MNTEAIKSGSRAATCYAFPVRRYLKRRLWKITCRATPTTAGKIRFVKHYERREAIGDPWKYVRGIAYEMQA
ncbi:MAG: hypothetical protein AAGJ81_08190 [Verrucomicrobiota bacterium]